MTFHSNHSRCNRRKVGTQGFWMRPRLLVAAALLMFLATAPGLPAAAPAPALDAVDLTKSVFVDDPKLGKDPFFPKSIRRIKQVAPEVPVVPVVAVVPDDSLVLKGLSGTAEKRLAIINNYTFQTGEEYMIRVNKTPLKVRCVEIRERSVVVSVNGTPKELKLRPTL